MTILDTLKSIYGSSDSSIQYTPSSEGLGIYFSDGDWGSLQKGKGSRLAQHQYVLLQMLLEQEDAGEIRSGIELSTSLAASLDSETRDTLLLPSAWPWKFKLQTEGLTYTTNFSANLILFDSLGKSIHHYQLDGPILRITSGEEYLLDENQLLVFSAASEFQAKKLGDHGEYDNLLLIHSMLEAKSHGLDIEITGFSELEIVKPENVGVAVNEGEDGGLDLIPTFAGGLNPQDISERLGQLSGEDTTSRIGVGKKIVLLDESKMKAVQEIIASQHIDAKDRIAFLENPTAWLSASLIDLDLGFSFRVLGAGPFRHAYFGETDESGISWFDDGSDDSAEAKTPVPIEPDDLGKVIKSRDELERFQKRLNDAISAGAESLVFKGHEVSLKNPEEITEALSQLDLTQSSEEGEGSGTGDDESEPTVIDIDDYDEEISQQSQFETPDSSIRSSLEIDYSAYSRIPYPHQKEAVSWLLGVAEKEWSPSLSELPHRGALLADDMGLGKTFISLVFIREYLEQVLREDSKRPVLIVAPLVLLENWKREIKEAYEGEYFNRITLLQAEADLPKFKLEGARSELSMNRGTTSELGSGQEPEINRGVVAEAEDMLEAIKYALKIGSSFGTNRLDLPNTVVLTTYQTLRDYQFSLGRVDWSAVIFDEAQNIKNPNALQTRAAKALKAKFKLVMTGTPVENHLGDFWCLFDTLQPGYLGAYQDFRASYIKPILSSSPEEVQDVRSDVGNQLREKVGGLMLRRIKEDHLEGLPEKRALLGQQSEGGEWEFDPGICRVMDGEQLERYNAVINTTIELMNEDENRGQALTGLHKLRQVSLHPDLLAGGQPQIATSAKEAWALISKSGKLQVTLEVLEKIKSQNEKAIIFLIDKKMQSALAIALRQIFHIEAAIINGDTKTFSKRSANATRQGIIDRFEGKESFDVLVMSPVAAGVGLTIVSANHVIHLERHWNPAKEAQATDRVYRIGQTKDVSVYYPILLHPESDSFDVNLNRLLMSKQGLKDAIIVPSPVSEQELTGSGMFGTGHSVKESALTIDDVDALSWEMFEALVTCLFSHDCKEAILTKGGRDKGADTVVIESDDSLTVVQSKHTKNTQRLDGYKAITEAYGAGPHYSKKLGREVKKKYVITNAKSYSGEGVQHAKTYGVELLARKDIVEMLKERKVKMSDVLRFDQKRRKL